MHGKCCGGWRPLGRENDITLMIIPRTTEGIGDVLNQIRGSGKLCIQTHKYWFLIFISVLYVGYPLYWLWNIDFEPILIYRLYYIFEFNMKYVLLKRLYGSIMKCTNLGSTIQKINFIDLILNLNLFLCFFIPNLMEFFENYIKWLLTKIIWKIIFSFLIRVIKLDNLI